MLSHDFIWTQEIEFPKQWENKYNCLLFWAGLLTSFTYLNTMMWLENTFNCQLPVKNRKIFYLATLTPSFINSNHSQVLECLRLKFCTSLKRSKQNARYDMRYAVFRALIWQTLNLFFLFYFILELFSISVVMINIAKIELINTSKICR